MVEKKIDELRERLHNLIAEKADYSKVLEVSVALDDYIAEFTYDKLREAGIDCNIKTKEQ